MSDSMLIPDSLLKEIRAKFMFVESCPRQGDRVFLDSASGSLRLRSVADVVAKEAGVPDQINRITRGSKHVMDTIERGKQAVKLFLGGDDSGVVMSALTATSAMFRAVRNAVAHYPGDNLVTTVLEHPSVYDSVSWSAGQYGKEVRVAPVDQETGAVSPDAILDLIDRNTSVLAFMHASNISGAYLDAEKIIGGARRINREICVIMDGVQYVPYAPVDVADLNPDVYVIAPYKCYTNKGLSFAYLSERFARIPHDKILNKPVDHWGLGSADHMGYAAWSATVDYLVWLGSQVSDPSASDRSKLVAAMTLAKNHAVGLLQILLHGRGDTPGLNDMEHIKTYGLGKETERSCVALFNIEGLRASRAVEMLLEKGIMIQTRKLGMSERILESLGVEDGEALRLSASHYTTPEEIERFLSIVAEMGT